MICSLAKVPGTTCPANPVDPNANAGTDPPKGQPYYEPNSNW